MPSLDSKYKHVTITNKTQSGKTVYYANGDTVTFKPGSTKKIGTKGLSGMPSTSDFTYDNPKMTTLIADGIVTPNGYDAPVADSGDSPSDADEEDSEQAGSSTASGGESEGGQQSGQVQEEPAEEIVDPVVDDVEEPAVDFDDEEDEETAEIKRLLAEDAS